MVRAADCSRAHVGSGCPRAAQEQPRGSAGEGVQWQAPACSALQSHREQQQGLGAWDSTRAAQGCGLWSAVCRQV